MGEPLDAILASDRRGVVYLADNLSVLQRIPDASIDLIYIDPPFNTGRSQQREQLRTVRDAKGDRVGFGGHRYKTERLGTAGFVDAFDDYLAFLAPRLEQLHRVLAPTGSLYVHVDYREVHYVKVMLDGLFGRANFLNEIIWAYDYGGRPRDRWPAKHDNILLYAKRSGDHLFNRDAIDRIPYMAPALQTPEKAALGKLPTDTWWHTIVSPTGKEKLGYPTQKPIAIVRRAVLASSPPGGLVLDVFAGSGTTGAAALSEGRRFVMVDCHPPALEVMRRRFANETAIEYVEGSQMAESALPPAVDA